MSRTLTVPCILPLLALAAPVLAQGPLTTAFTYQGELRSGGNPATGLYDLRFHLFDSPSAGTQLGSTLCADNVTLTGGRFTISLDFGSQYAGQQLFLEIDVRPDTGLDCSNSAGFITLGPRQPLTAAPYAGYALSAANAAAATNAAQLNGQGASYYTNSANLTGTIPSGLLSGAYANPLTLSNASNSFSGSGAGLVALNASSLSSGTLDPARLPVPLNLAGSNATAVITGTNAATDVYAAGLLGLATASSGYTNGVYGQTSSPDGNGLFGLATAATGQAWGVYGQSTSTSGTGVYGDDSATSGFTFGGQFFTHSPNGLAVNARSTAATGFTYGVYGESASNAGVALGGNATATSGTVYGGWFGATSSPGGVGVRGDAQTQGGYFIASGANGVGVEGSTTVASGLAYGVKGDATSTSGVAVEGIATATTGSTIGVRGENNSPAGIGVDGITYAASGATYGVYGESRSTSGAGVKGYATTTTGSTYGVFGQSASASGIGVYGSGAGAGGQFDTTTGVGVSGSASSGSAGSFGGYFTSYSTSGQGAHCVDVAGSGTTYGVVGEVISAGGYGVYSLGRLAATGTKSFRIDHPADPENKYLIHYCAEGPEPLNIYRGTVALDSAGNARVDLPDYFARINTAPTYQLTALNGPMPLLHIARRIDAAALTAGNAAAPGDAVPVVSFVIGGGTPGGEVSWRIEAARNDRWVQRYGAPVETDKAESERGTYQHPELYNQPREAGAAPPAPRLSPRVPAPLPEFPAPPTLTHKESER